MKGYEARVIVELGDYRRNVVRLAVVDRDTGGLLLSDGSWSYGEPGVVSDHPVGIVLPPESLDAIAAAIDEYRGLATHGPTEVKVLREALEVERRRVDAILTGSIKS